MSIPALGLNPNLLFIGQCCYRTTRRNDVFKQTDLLQAFNSRMVRSPTFLTVSFPLFNAECFSKPFFLLAAPIGILAQCQHYTNLIAYGKLSQLSIEVLCSVTFIVYYQGIHMQAYTRAKTLCQHNSKMGIVVYHHTRHETAARLFRYTAFRNFSTMWTKILATP